MIQNQALVGYSETEPGAINSLLTQAPVIGNPNEVALEANTYAVNCYLFQKDVATGFQTVVWQNTGTVAVPVWTTVNLTAGTVLTVKVSLTSAQILALHTTPIQLIAAPGAGLALQVLSVMGRMNFLTAAYATHTALDITDATLGHILFSDASALLAAGSTLVATVIPNANSSVGVIVTANGALNATVATGDPVTGAGSLDLYITYRVITL